MYPIITISREYGSCGHSIGQAVAKELGIPFYDSEIVNEAASKSGYAKDFIKEHGEYTSAADNWFYGNASFALGLIKSPQDEIFRIQYKTILDYVKEGPCVIVGRCADYIMAREGIPSLNVFIHADMEFRKKIAVERYGEDADNIDRILKKKDKGRKTYYRYYTDLQWGDYHNYQLNLDSGYLGEQACVDMIVEAAKGKENG